MRRTCCLFSVVTALTAALVLFSSPVYADDAKCPKDKVCKPATTVVKADGKSATKPASTPAESARPAPPPTTFLEKYGQPAPDEPAVKKTAAPAEGAKPDEPKKEGEAKTAEKPESKPAPAATPKPDEPTKPAESKGGDDELVSVYPGDVTAGAEAAMNHGFQAGYTKGHADGMAAATKKKYRIMSREEVIKLSLDAAQKAIERRLGPSPEKKAP